MNIYTCIYIYIYTHIYVHIRPTSPSSPRLAGAPRWGPRVRRNDMFRI